MEYGYIIILGIIFLFAHFLRVLGRWSRLPFITILILSGFLFGPSVLKLIPEPSPFYLKVVSHLSLSLIGFILGARMVEIKLNVWREIKISGLLSLSNIFFITTMAILVLNLPFYLALILATIGSLTAPTTALSIVEETHETSRFSQIYISAIVFCKIVVLFIFPFTLVFYQPPSGGMFILAVGEQLGLLFLSVAYGALIGFLLLIFGNLTRTKEILTLEVVGSILLIAGFAIYIDFIPTLSGMMAGYILRIRAQENYKSVTLARELEWLAFTPFFLLAGVKINLESIAQLGFMVAEFLVILIFARIISAIVVKPYTQQTLSQAAWLGTALIPLGGVALGVALYTINYIPEQSDIILHFILGAMIFFEIFLTPFTKQALLRNRD